MYPPFINKFTTFVKDKQIIMKNTLKFILFAMLLACATSSFGGNKPRKGFLYREGTQLMLDGKKYQSVSFNSAQLSGCGHDYEVFPDEEIDSLFKMLPKGILIRTWAFPGNEERIKQLIDRAEKYGHKLLLTLGDGRSGCGHHDGAKNGDGTGKKPEWYTEGYKKEYLPHVRNIVKRFKDSPAVGMWEIINEPGDASWQDIKKFYDTIATEIKQIDANHLVSSGSWAPWAYNGLEPFQEMHTSPYIDVGCIHEYDYDYNQSNTIESPHFAVALKAMQSLNKVLIVEETGIESGKNCRTDYETRAKAMKEKINIYLQKGSCAVLIWNLARKVKGCALNFTPSDPLMSIILHHPANQH